MSKMSNIAMELDEKAVELGFADHLEAMANGYDWGVNESGEAFLFKQKDEQEKAHEAWLEEKEEVLDELHSVINNGELDWGEIVRKVEHAIEFVEGCRD